MFFIFDFDGTLVQLLDTDYSSLRKDLQTLYETDKEFCPLIQTITSFKDEKKQKKAFKLIDFYDKVERKPTTLVVG